MVVNALIHAIAIALALGVDARFVGPVCKCFGALTAAARARTPFLLGRPEGSQAPVGVLVHWRRRPCGRSFPPVASDPPDAA